MYIHTESLVYVILVCQIPLFNMYKNEYTEGVRNKHAHLSKTQSTNKTKRTHRGRKSTRINANKVEIFLESQHLVSVHLNISSSFHTGPLENFQLI